MIDLKQFEIWFITGSQHLYGPKTLGQVAEHSQAIAAALSASDKIPVKVVFKPVLTTADAIHALCLEANTATNCVGLITWMHTFSPAQMWMAGLLALKKPFVHLHTQFNTEIPWAEIDMNFMNLNQAAHGDREFGFIGSRMRLNRKVVVGQKKSAGTTSTIYFHKDCKPSVGEIDIVGLAGKEITYGTLAGMRAQSRSLSGASPPRTPCI